MLSWLSTDVQSFLGQRAPGPAQAGSHRVDVGLGTDVGAGTNFSLIQMLNEAYKVMQLEYHNFHLSGRSIWPRSAVRGL